MTVELFRQRLTRAQLHPNGRQWMPTWLEQYAIQQPPGIEALEVTEETYVNWLLRFIRPSSCAEQTRSG